MSPRYFYLLAFLLIAGCQKDKESSKAVVEGTLSLEVHATHHDLDVPAITIYLMRNSTSFPGNDSSIYTFHGLTDGYGKHTFEKLFPGNYYVYASGFDSLWQMNVTGNIPVELSTATVDNNWASVRVIVGE